MYGNPYITTYNPQVSVDRINNQINELENMKKQLQQPIQQPTNLTQNFQLTPVNRESIKYANSIEEVNRDIVIGDTPYFSKDMSVVWIKNTKGEIKTYELQEIVPQDEKDLEIALLKAQIDKLEKEMIKNEQHITNVNEPEVSTDTATTDEPTGEPIKENKPTSVSRVSTSKKK